MTVAAEPLTSPARRCLNNLAVAFSLLTRAPRTHPKGAWLLPPRQLAVAALVAIGVLLVGMFLIDAQISGRMRGLPHWMTSFFDSITDYGKSGYVLWPLGILFLFLCALPPILPRFQQRVLATIMVRIGFLF